MPRRSSAQTSSYPQTPPGIYDLPGTSLGETAKIAYDQNEEFVIRYGKNAQRQLERWLQRRGVRVSGSRPAVFLLRCVAIVLPLLPAV